jgi:hypothetical protein
MEGQSKRSRGLEAYCKGGQGPPGAVVPSKRKSFYTGNRKRKHWIALSGELDLEESMKL